MSRENERAGWKVIAIFFSAVVVAGFIVAIVISPPVTGTSIQIGSVRLFIPDPLGRLFRSKPAPRVSPCINNLRTIDAAKEQWYLENNATNGAVVTTNGLLRYLAHNQFLKCSYGGVYTLGRIGEPPTCTVPGHSLP